MLFSLSPAPGSFHYLRPQVQPINHVLLWSFYFLKYELCFTFVHFFTIWPSWWLCLKIITISTEEFWGVDSLSCQKTHTRSFSCIRSLLVLTTLFYTACRSTPGTCHIGPTFDLVSQISAHIVVGARGGQPEAILLATLFSGKLAMSSL